jgi:hypothetical protein
VFTPEYKLAIGTECENAPNGEKGAILRREGLYSSHVIEWTRARDAGTLTASRPADPAAPSKRTKKSAEQVELEKLRRRNAKLESDLTKTRLAVAIQLWSERLVGAARGAAVAFEMILGCRFQDCPRACPLRMSWPNWSS